MRRLPLLLLPLLLASCVAQELIDLAKKIEDDGRESRSLQELTIECAVEDLRGSARLFAALQDVAAGTRPSPVRVTVPWAAGLDLEVEVEGVAGGGLTTGVPVELLFTGVGSSLVGEATVTRLVDGRIRISDGRVAGAPTCAHFLLEEVSWEFDPADLPTLLPEGTAHLLADRNDVVTFANVLDLDLAFPGDGTFAAAGTFVSAGTTGPVSFTDALQD